MIDVDDVRLQLFINTYMVSDVNEEFNRKNVKNFDVSNLPASKSELLQQFRRANYFTSLWSNAHMMGLGIFSPENNGWTLEDNQYHISTSLMETSYRPLRDTKDADEDIQYKNRTDDEILKLQR
ncbi:hypothetical protein TNIN_121421 [Trichonephila inaurata madagascariensis]|uniref:Uncharacterized protein n=1 Tax=Trichonephila inaurata madagascariensis TaxID=2747483 RepID=A0A8X7C215_9ARAC|nr:hypothetical protein TNIN_121421 [Trichonephila inaurata madagascariensis]